MANDGEILYASIGKLNLIFDPEADSTGSGSQTIHYCFHLPENEALMV
jgi:hypothetical protein